MTFSWHRLSSDDDWEKLFPAVRWGEPRAVENTLTYLREHALARSVLVERHYVDRDHRAAFSYFYSRQFRGTPSLCERLHFFASDQEDWDALGGEHAPPASSYLGYVIRRPTASAPIGRSVLAIDAAKVPGARVYCSGRFEPHINDTRFQVDGVPFAQQDSMVMSCAETSIWISARVMSKNFHHPLILPDEITRPEIIGRADHGRLLPSNGLTANQMTHALSALGFEPIHYDWEAFRSSHIDPIETCTPYLVSKIPTILAFPGHAVTACGLIRRAGAPRPDEKVFLHSVHEWIEGLIIQDDSRGPYRIVARDAATHAALRRSDVSSLLITRVPERPSVDRCSCWCARHVEGILIPLPERMYLTGADAQHFAQTVLAPDGLLPALRDILELLAKRGHGDARTFLDAALHQRHGGLVYSVRCRKSVDVRRDFALARPRVREIMRDVPLPRQLWAIEVTTREAFEREEPEQRFLYGELYLDATAHKHADLSQLVLARIVGAMLVRPGLCRGDDTPVISGIPDDACYFRSGIPLWSD